MANWLYHALVGNDRHPVVVAGTRAVLGSVIIGAISFFGVWQATDDPKALITAGCLPALTYIAQRLGVEGYLDMLKYRRNGG